MIPSRSSLVFSRGCLRICRICCRRIRLLSYLSWEGLAGLLLCILGSRWSSSGLGGCTVNGSWSLCGVGSTKGLTSFFSPPSSSPTLEARIKRASPWWNSDYSWPWSLLACFRGLVPANFPKVWCLSSAFWRLTVDHWFPLAKCSDYHRIPWSWWQKSSVSSHQWWPDYIFQAQSPLHPQDKT